jgi:hypothetical protein
LVTLPVVYHGEVAKEDNFIKVMVALETVRALEVGQEDFKVAVVLEAVVRAVVAAARGKPVEMNGVAYKNQLQILMLNWTSITQKQ